MESIYHLSSLFIIGKRCSPGYVLDEGSTTCVGVTSKLYSVGNQASGNTACGAFKDGSGTLVSGSVLCGNGYRGTIQVLLFFSKSLCKRRPFSSLIQTYVIKFCAIFQTVLEANEYTDGVWIGSNSGSSPFAGDSYSQWKFYDGSDLSQCYDKDCDSGEGKSSKN